MGTGGEKLATQILRKSLCNAHNRVSDSHDSANQQQTKEGQHPKETLSFEGKQEAQGDKPRQRFISETIGHVAMA